MSREQKGSLKAIDPGGSNFLISIQHQDNHTWQGYIEWLEVGERLHFRSELEMLSLIQNALGKNLNRNWGENFQMNIAK